MSKQRLLSSLAAICAALVVTARLCILYFPISAPAQEVRTGEANLLHRAPIQYPSDAIEKGIEGTVIVEATVNERGGVADARVVSGPEALRKAALKSVLDWHYSTQTQSPVQIAIDFKLPDRKLGTAAPYFLNPARQEPKAPSTPAESGKLNRIHFAGVPARFRDELAGRLPVRVGDEIRADTLSRIRQAVREVDEHLDARWDWRAKSDDGKEFGLIIFSTAPMEAAPAQAPDSSPSAPRIRVGGNLQAAKVIYAPKPAYPLEAKQARIQGVVRLNVIIGKDGPIKDVQVAFGHPLLAEVAVEAVRRWVYEPTLLNGDRVEVVSVVDVNFTLSQ